MNHPKCDVCDAPADVIWSGDSSVRCADHLTEEVVQVIESNPYQVMEILCWADKVAEGVSEKPS